MQVEENNELVTMLLNQTNPVGVQLFSYVNTFFSRFQYIYMAAGHVSEYVLYRENSGYSRDIPGLLWKSVA